MTPPARAPARDELLLDVQRGMAAIVRRVPLLQRRVLQRAGLTLDRSAHLVLDHLAELGPTRLTGVAERLGVDLSFVSRQVQRLEREGLVRRAADPADGRAAVVEVSREGRAVLARVSAGWQAVLREALRDWSAEDLERFRTLVRRYGEGLLRVLGP